MNKYIKSYIKPTFLLPVLVSGCLYTILSFFSQPVFSEDIMVYKSPTCGCCKKWIKHLEEEGFNVTAKDTRNMKEIKKKMGVQPYLQSCHTAKVGKYYIEGHVSASDIKRLLKEKPDIKGLSVPGMPMGSPGMEGHRKDKYNVIAIDNDNNPTVYSKH